MQTSSQTKNGDSNDKQVALFIDFENVAISAEESFGRLQTEILIQTSEQLGRCITRRAYGDWTRFSKYSQDLLEHAIEAIQLFHYGGINDKNAADIQMVADILEMLFTHPEIEIFVLATGDSDFSAVARKLRSYGKYVIGIGLRQATSEVLVKACDQFLIYDTIVEPATRTQSYSLEQARQLLLNTMLEMTRQTGNTQILAGALKHLMLQKDPTFSQVKLGFSQFRDFLVEQRDMVELGNRENQVVVSLKASMTEIASHDPSLEYRKALDREGLLLLDPYTRTDVLRDLFILLQENPQRYTLLNAEIHLKARYDSTNILRSRDEVHEAVKLMRYVDVVTPTPQSWELDTLSLKQGLDQQAFIDLCESIYVAALVTRNLPIDPELISKLLFGTADKRARVTQLINLVRSRAPLQIGRSKKAQNWQWPANIAQNPSLKGILLELERFELSGEPTLERAMQASDDGMRVRSSDFGQAQHSYLEAAKITYQLLQEGVPGASLVDLKWHLASYCATAAGAAFFSHDYSTAIKYYHAFFAIAVETEPIWEKVERLVQPMLSFYFTTAANQEHIMLDASPGRQHPAKIITLIFNHPNPQVQERGLKLARDLAEINPALLRKVIQRLETITTNKNGEKPPEEDKAQQTLIGILRSSNQS